ncbi:MAG TPA: hypothetical protein VM432_10730, partial [Bdellovibrionales bacterium]|nr:hypothetical protein [Bdellovibrionales bacterium]
MVVDGGFMRKQDACDRKLARIFSLALVFAAVWLLEVPVFAMSKDSSAELLDNAAVLASDELKILNQQFNADIRTRVQTELYSGDLILPIGPEIANVAEPKADVENAAQIAAKLPD